MGNSDEIAKMIAAAIKGNGMPSSPESEERRVKSKPHPEAIVATLKEIAERYGKVPFKNGDIVTPRKGYNLRGAGNPHVVLEVADPPHTTFHMGDEPSAYGTSQWGTKADIRVAMLAGGPEGSRDGHYEYAAFWAEAWQYEFYTGEGA